MENKRHQEDPLGKLEILIVKKYINCSPATCCLALYSSEGIEHFPFKK